MFIVEKDTTCKLIKLFPNKDAEVVDWVVTKRLVFQESLINPSVIKSIVNSVVYDPSSKKPLAVRMAEQGYALFGGESGGDRSAIYVLAVPYDSIKIEEKISC